MYSCNTGLSLPRQTDEREAHGEGIRSSGFVVGIWLVGVDKATIVWTTFHEEPPYKSNATLDFTEDGKLLLRTDEGQEKLVADAIDSASHASMLDYGNFVLYGIDPKIIWQSFDYLIDTILGGQTLFAGAQLFSSLTGNNHSTGRFHLKMPLDENLVLYPINTRDTPGDAYWSSNTFVKGFKFHLYLNHTGLLLYSHTYDDESSKLNVSSLSWSALDNLYEVKGVSGFNSFCTFDGAQRDCLCLPVTDFIDSNHRSLGCVRNFSEEVFKGGKENAAFYNITTIENLVLADRAYFRQSMSMEECRKPCLEDSDCGEALFKSSACMNIIFH
ncbi:G-type lectin S-receptor-like serine/threonine-protein kinase LECRK3 [Quercus lobata]|uniref:G-type lectin S-receptor-like serine/threonine-protein kinase LECRK3 n=1 Tax=Quercus lobata TaxID=97700 RepID=UPI001245529F|nr:G-type lectin S-receptor-like serine/threonine-protein kinase LECRK3 [Quercus lobata]